MSLRNTEQQYGALAKGFHWLIAVLIITILAIGLIMVDMDRGAGKFALFRWHKALGITVLALAMLRICWRLGSLQPLTLATHAAWEKMLSGAAHFLLYFCMVAMPLSGWLMSSAKGVAVSAWGFTLPDLIGQNRPLGQLLTTFHVYTAYGLIGLIALHAAGALKHHVIDRDETLRRMLPFGRISAGIGLAVLTVAMILRMISAAGAPQTGAAMHVAAVPATPVTPGLLAPMAPPPAAAAATWVIDQGQSHLTFEGTQNEAPFTGTFASFDGTIAFDPGHLDASRVTIRIPMKDVKTGSEERDGSIGGKDWFDVDAFPESTYTAESFEKKGEGQYVAHGKLTLRGIAVPVDLPFSLSIETDAGGRKTAKMQGETTLQRLDYGIGTGEWSDPKAVGTTVKVKVVLQAHGG